jgi:flavoprotein
MSEISFGHLQHVPSRVLGGKCVECGQISPPSNSICYDCVGYGDYQNQACFNCELCVETRKYLEQTSSQFQFIGFSIDAELWKCNECGYCLRFQPSYKCISKDMLQEKYRKLHIEKQCNLLKTRQVEIF